MVAAVDGELIKVPIDQLVRNPYQPRRHFDPKRLQELADSFVESTVIEPIVGRRHPRRAGIYEIAAGERRWRAAGLAQMEDVPFLLRSLTDKQMAVMAIVENVQRVELGPLEEARGYQTLRDEFEYTGRQIAEEVGKSESHISHVLKLLTLDERVQAYLDEGLLELGHGKVLTGVPGPRQFELAAQAVAHKWPVRQLEKAAKQLPVAGKQEEKKSKSSYSTDPNIRQMEQEYTLRLGSPLRLVPSKSGKWTVTIECSSLDELDGVLQHIK